MCVIKTTRILGTFDPLKRNITMIIIYSKYFRSFDWLRAKCETSYPLDSCPNLGLKINIRHYESFCRILKTNKRHYDSFRRMLTDLVI